MVTSEARRRSPQGSWTSRLAFVLALSGAAVGLGNIWKFPYIAGVNGGGAFVLIYLVCVFAVGLPIMMSEILIGRRGRRNPIATMGLLGEEESGNRKWWLVGLLGVGGSFIILSYYSVVAGWAVAYIFESVSGDFSGANPDQITAIFGGLTGNWVASAFWHTLFMGMTVFVVVRGVVQGLERAVRVLMPVLLGLLLLLLGYSMVEGEFVQGLIFMFEPRFDELTPTGVLSALGHAFFTLSIGMGAVMAYGAYVPDNVSISATSVTVVCMDTGIALITGLVIFPIVFANGLDPAEGPGLIFVTLPLAFGNIPGGTIVATTFFLLLSFAAWTSAISLIEPVVAWVTESRGISRKAATIGIGIAIWGLGLLSVLSFNAMADVNFMWGTYFDSADFLTSNIMLPAGGFAIAVFAGWIMSRRSTAGELRLTNPAAYRLWRFGSRFVAPAAVVLIFLNAIGVLGWLGMGG